MIHLLNVGFSVDFTCIDVWKSIINNITRLGFQCQLDRNHVADHYCSRWGIEVSKLILEFFLRSLNHLESNLNFFGCSSELLPDFHEHQLKVKAITHALYPMHINKRVQEIKVTTLTVNAITFALYPTHKNKCLQEIKA